MVKILAIVPMYIEGRGNCTKLITVNGHEMVLNKNIDIVLIDILKSRLVCYDSLIKKTREITSINRYFPLYVTSFEMLIPMKVREVKVIGDRAYGYINENYIESLYKGVIKVKKGFEFKLIERESTFNKRRSLCKKIKEEFYMDKNLALIYGDGTNINEKVEEIENELKELTKKLSKCKKSK